MVGDHAVGGRHATNSERNVTALSAPQKLHKLRFAIGPFETLLKDVK